MPDNEKVTVTLESVSVVVERMTNVSFLMSKASKRDVIGALDYATHAATAFLKVLDIPSTPEVQRAMGKIMASQMELHYGHETQLVQLAQKKKQTQS